MKKYLLCTILVGNVALGMDLPLTDFEKAQLIERLTVEASNTVSGIERDKFNRIIGRLRKELNASNPENVPLPSETKELDKIIEAMPAENAAASNATHTPDLLFTDEEIASMPVEEFKQTFGAKAKIPTAAAERFSKLAVMELEKQMKSTVESWSIEQIKEYLAKNSGKAHVCTSDFLEKFTKRCHELKFDPTSNQQVLPPLVEVLPDFDQIPHMNKEQLLAFQEQLAAQEVKINVYIKSTIDARLDALNRTNSELPVKSILKSTDPERALSPKKGHITFTGVPSDSDGSGIARPTKPAQITSEEIPAPFNTADFQEDSDFEEKISNPNVDTNPPTATPGPEIKVGTDSIPQIAIDASPLARAASPTELIETPASRGATTTPPPAPQDFKAEPSASPAPDAPDTSGDAELAARLTAENKTPGNHDTPKLPIDVADGSRGDSANPVGIARESGAPSGTPVATLADLKAAEKAEAGETPGGPDSSDEVSAIDSPADQGLQQGPQPNPDSSYTTTQKFLIGAGVAAVVYAATETVLAYRSITPEQWKNTHGVFKKANLVLNKTWENVKARPTQGVDLLKDLAKRARAA